MEIRLKVRGRKQIVRFENIKSIRCANGLMSFRYVNIEGEEKITNFTSFDILEFYIKENNNE